MAKAAEEKSDGLEIISIGKLYSGPWEKKYWSSSRGKDRYPYPVEFKAVRTQNGITYRMEIFEGLKGPLFKISSTDGLSCSGQTPDIAWESFQKKGCSRPKLWHGKRFSCKIDGMETIVILNNYQNQRMMVPCLCVCAQFFGFKNAFVQRLLRQLAANVGGPAEQNLLPSCICNKASKTGDPIPQTELSTLPDLLPYLEKARVTRKRSRKENIIRVNSKNVDDLKKVHTQSQGNNSDESNIRQSSQGNHSDTCSATISNSNQNVFDNKAGALQGSEKLEPTTKDENLLVLAENCLHSNSLDVSDHLKVDGIYSQDKIKLTSCRSYIPLEEDRDLPKEKETFNSSVTEDEDGERPGQRSVKTTNDSERCAPDTLDHPPDMTISEVLMSESHLEDEMDAGSSNPSSEKADFDSVGQQIAKSMMLVLLPRALPLLKTFSRRKRNNLKTSEQSAHMSTDENTKTADILSPVIGLKETTDLNQNKKDAHNSGTTNGWIGHLESVVPDSFDNEESEKSSSKKLCLFPDIMVEDQTPVDPETCQSERVLEAKAGRPGYHLEATDSTIELISNRGPYEGDNFTSKSSIDFTFAAKRDTFVSFSNSLFVANQFVEENIKILPHYIEGILDPANSGQEKSETYDNKELAQDKYLAEMDSSISDLQIQTVSCSSDTAPKKEVEDGSKSNDNVNWRHNSEMEDVLKIVACCIHPTPILMVLLSTVGNDIYLCLLCGSLALEDKILFVYNAPITGETTGCPSFLGHSSVILPSLEDAFGRNIALESPGLQFTPDAQCLVLLNGIRVPCCRVGNIHCPCALCTSDCFGGNALKIVKVKFGHVSVVTKLKTAQTVRSLLVCEPNHLLAADESGKLYLWVMNSRWSQHVEECYLSIPEHMHSSVAELKRIPKYAALVVGHNGFGEFGLWDIDKRILVAKFSSPCTSVSKCVPVSLFQWQRKGSVRTSSNPDKLINEVLDATKMSFSVGTENKLALSVDSEDLAIWLLVSTTSGPEYQHGYQSGDLQIDSAGCWRLALLVKDMVILGSALDLRAAVVGASSGHGIIGRSDGLVYMWELSTGIKVGSLHHLRGVSCIATDSSNSGALAIAGEEGKLLVYMHS